MSKIINKIDDPFDDNAGMISETEGSDKSAGKHGLSKSTAVSAFKSVKERLSNISLPKKPFKLKFRIGFFLLAFVIMEIFVRISDTHSPFFGLPLFRCIFAGAAFGALVFLIGFLIPRKGIARGITIFFLFSMPVLCMIQALSRVKFGTYFQVAYMFKMAGNAVGNFMGDIIGLFFGGIWLLPFMFGPGIIFIIFRKNLLPAEFVKKTRKNKKRKRAYMLRHICLFAALAIVALILCWVGSDRQYYTYNFTATNAVPRFGIINTLRLEIEYGIFGTPRQKISLDAVNSEKTSDETGTDVNETTAAAVSEKVYKKNVMDIDFDALIESDDSEIYELMDTYFQSQEPTSQNEYTGLFEGKNLIFLSGEAFSTLVVDKERTPALWRLSHTGFVFENYYQPDFDQSTTGGEFSNMTGVIPLWIDGMPTYLASEYNYMPFGLGTVFGNLGYTVTAWHDGDYDYYYRPELYPNMGYYDYYAINGGLDIQDIWPGSDLEMMEAALDNQLGDQIDEYLTNGTPFHAYMMTISGHGGYEFSGNNNMAIKNQEITDGLTGYEIIDAYLAANMELEYAMEYLLEELEKKGILDDTVIVMGADHWPYYLTENQDQDYYAIAAGLTEDDPYTEWHHNTLILWSGSIENDTRIIETPCFSCDIVPTLLNLFGIEYDSRLFSGRDIFSPDVKPGEVATNMHVVCFVNGSWVTAAGIYDSLTGRFYPAEGVVLENEDEYIEAVSDLVSMRCTFARYIVEFDYYAHVFG